ncbi:ribonuclease Z [Mesobacillus maritimus]|uniref:ribonuclease Z n=1 Tax=Mesobacillus maritimus TaxID=1643336 RepID=UPI00203FD13F|nr:ribonuclease Z [Mesobacillus maritimus]MCM3586418.1 ribonuclease Z [Mesobacillus maritimus]MCM3669550.1 ribonuclease Z [Mesobacillus maritimus]
MDVFFLGTGAGVPAKLRNVTSIALKLLEERGSIWLFDCGEATQHQILHTSIKPRRIEKVFITHLHGDHIYGLPGLLSSRSFQGGNTKVTVYGPSGIKDYLDISLRVSKTYLKYPLEIIEVEEGTVFEDHQFHVEAKLLDHGLPSFGYRVVEKDLPGQLLADKLQAIGVKPGPIYKKIKEGHTVEFNGQKLNPSDFLGKPQKGRIVTILGDTRPCDAIHSLAKDADFLIHEATFAGDDGELAHEYYHSTTIQAAEAAQIANVKKLCLTHISSRYDREAWLQLVQEARTVFAETMIAEDFLEVGIPLRKD